MITNLRLINFKSFRDTSIPLSRFSLVIGANGAGKSNLFDALRFLRAIGQGRSVRDALEGRVAAGPVLSVIDGVRGGAQASTYFGSTDREFEMQVSVESSGQKIEYVVRVDVERFRVVKEQLASSVHGGEYVFSTFPETGALANDLEAPVIQARFHKAARGLNPKRDFSPWEFILNQFTGRKAESNGNQEVADLLRAELDSVNPLELRPEVLRTYSTRGTTVLGEHGENFAGAVAELIASAQGFPVVADRQSSDENTRSVSRSRYQALLGWIDRVTPRGISELLALPAPTGEVIFGVKEHPFEHAIAAPSLSDGTLRFAALAFAAIDPGQDRKILVIEEIENGVNPSRLPFLVQMLDQVSQADEETQIVASTHSPAVLDAAGTDVVEAAVVVGWDEENASSVVRRITELPGFNDIVASGSATLGELQMEGWINAAAGV